MAELRFESASISKAQAVITTTYCDMQEAKGSKVMMCVRVLALGGLGDH